MELKEFRTLADGSIKRARAVRSGTLIELIPHLKAGDCVSKPSWGRSHYIVSNTGVLRYSSGGHVTLWVSGKKSGEIFTLYRDIENKTEKDDKELYGLGPGVITYEDAKAQKFREQWFSCPKVHYGIHYSNLEAQLNTHLDADWLASKIKEQETIGHMLPETWWKNSECKKLKDLRLSDTLNSYVGVDRSKVKLSQGDNMQNGFGTKLDHYQPSAKVFSKLLEDQEFSYAWSTCFYPEPRSREIRRVINDDTFLLSPKALKVLATELAKVEKAEAKEQEKLKAEAVKERERCGCDGNF